MNCLVVGKGGLPSSRNGARMVPCRLPDASHCARSSRGAGCKRQACRQSLSWRGFAAFRIPACHATKTSTPSTGELFSPIFGQASFPEIILTNTKRSVQHPYAPSDRNCGATLTRAGALRTQLLFTDAADTCCANPRDNMSYDCVPPSNLRNGEADGDAPV